MGISAAGSYPAGNISRAFNFGIAFGHDGIHHEVPLRCTLCFARIDDFASSVANFRRALSSDSGGPGNGGGVPGATNRNSSAPWGSRAMFSRKVDARARLAKEFSASRRKS